MTTPEPHFASASLYVGDLHPDVNETMLFEVFNPIGSVASIRVCRESGSRKSLRYAYVNYHSIHDAERALDTLNYTPIKGTPCRIMWSHRDPSLRHSGTGNIFVKNLDKMIDNKALYDTFSLFGNILSCKVATDEYGRSKGYGFVHYESEESGRAAIEKVNNMQIESKTVYVGPFQRRIDRKDEREANFTNVYVKQFPSEWTEDTLRGVFSPFGEITSLVISRDQLNRPFGFVNFKDPTCAKTCIMELHNRRTTSVGVLDKDDPSDLITQPSSDNKAHQPLATDQRTNESNPDQSAKVKDEITQDTAKETNPTAADENRLYVQRAMSKAERRHYFKQTTSTTTQKQKQPGVNLFVKNLDSSVTDNILREAFSKFGTVTSAKVMHDDSKVSKGFGFVSFAFPDEATSAVTAMHLNIFHGKPLYVGLAEKRDHRTARLQRYRMPNVPGVRFPTYASSSTITPIVMGHRGGAMPPQIMPFHPTAGPTPIYYSAGAVPNGQPQLHKGIRSTLPQVSYVGPHTQIPSTSDVWRQQDVMGAKPSYTGFVSPSNSTAPTSAVYPSYPLSQGVGANSAGNIAMNQHFKFTPEVRNRQGFPLSETTSATPISQVQHHLTPGGLQADVVKLLTTHDTKPAPPLLPNAHPQIQKQLLGEKLFPLVHKRQPELAGKITGMMLEIDNVELLSLLDSDSKLDAKINEALAVLRRHQQGAAMPPTGQRSMLQQSSLVTQPPQKPGVSLMSTSEISNN